MKLNCLASAANSGGPNYVLLDLPPPLLEAYKSNTLVLKAQDSSGKVFACTKTQSYSLALAPQNPTLMFATPRAAESDDVGSKSSKEFDLLVSGVVEKRLEPRLSNPIVDWTKIACYDIEGQGVAQLRGPELSFQDVMDTALCSEVEFNELWRIEPCAIIDGKAARLGAAIVADIAADIVTALVAEGEHKGELDWDQAQPILDIKQPTPVLQAVYQKFWRSDTKRLDFETIALFIGQHRLRQLVKPQLEHQFVTEWSRELPVHGLKYSMEDLAGHFVRLPGDMIMSLDASTLPAMPKQRLEKLLSIKSAWSLDDMTPYLVDIAPKNIKLDAWLKRYARIQVVAGSGDKIVRARRG